MTTRLITAPAAYPVTLAEAKEHVRVEASFTDDDTYINGLIRAATAQAEVRLARRLITQTWDLLLDEWPGDGCISLPFGTLQSIAHIKYTDEDAAEHTFDTANYGVRTASLLGQAVLKPDASWPSDALYNIDPIVVRFDCGYGTAGSAVPADIVHAVKLLIADGYEFRESGLVGTVAARYKTNMAVKHLLAPYRIWSMPI